MTNHISALRPLADRSAVLSTCGTYRYLLTRSVGPGERWATFILLNPSTADARTDDPTIRRCIGFARLWRCGRLNVLNLFAFRATRPTDLKQAADPVGPENRAWFERTLLHQGVGPVVCGWGVHGRHLGQDRIVLEWLEQLGVKAVTLGATKDGHPRHPLYLPYTAAWTLSACCPTHQRARTGSAASPHLDLS
jgi:hypothetical protein